jgi:hypothetical protein
LIHNSADSGNKGILCQRRLNMKNERDNRVLGRIHARELSDQELTMVAGGTTKISHLPNGEVDVLADT